MLPASLSATCSWPSSLEPTELKPFEKLEKAVKAAGRPTIPRSPSGSNQINQHRMRRYHILGLEPGVCATPCCTIARDVSMSVVHLYCVSCPLAPSAGPGMMKPWRSLHEHDVEYFKRLGLLDVSPMLELWLAGM